MYSKLIILSILLFVALLLYTPYLLNLDTADTSQGHHIREKSYRTMIFSFAFVLVILVLGVSALWYIFELKGTDRIMVTSMISMFMGIFSVYYTIVFNSISIAKLKNLKESRPSPTK